MNILFVSALLLSIVLPSPILAAAGNRSGSSAMMKRQATHVFGDDYQAEEEISTEEEDSTEDASSPSLIVQFHSALSNQTALGHILALISKDPSCIGLRDSNHYDLLHLTALYCESDETANTLALQFIQYGIEINRRAKGLATALHCLFYAMGDIKKKPIFMKTLIDNGNKVLICDSEGSSVVHLAAHSLEPALFALAVTAGRAEQQQSNNPLRLFLNSPDICSIHNLPTVLQNLVLGYLIQPSLTAQTKTHKTVLHLLLEAALKETRLLTTPLRLLGSNMSKPKDPEQPADTRLLDMVKILLLQNEEHLDDFAKNVPGLDDYKTIKSSAKKRKTPTPHHSTRSMAKTPLQLAIELAASPNPHGNAVLALLQGYSQQHFSNPLPTLLGVQNLFSREPIAKRLCSEKAHALALTD